MTYTALSDPGNQVAGQLGILTAPAAGAQVTQATFGIDLTKINAAANPTRLRCAPPGAPARPHRGRFRIGVLPRMGRWGDRCTGS